MTFQMAGCINVVCAVSLVSCGSGCAGRFRRSTLANTVDPNENRRVFQHRDQCTHATPCTRMCYTKQPRQTRAKQRLYTRPIHKTTTSVRHLLICIGLYTAATGCADALMENTHGRAVFVTFVHAIVSVLTVIIALAKNKRINFYYSHCLRSSVVTGSYTHSHCMRAPVCEAM